MLKKDYRIEEFIMKHYQIPQSSLTIDSKNALLRAIVLEKYFDMSTQLIDVSRLAKDMDYTYRGIKRRLERLHLQQFLEYGNWKKPRMKRLSDETLLEMYPQYLENGIIHISKLAKDTDYQPQAIRWRLKKLGLSHLIGNIHGGYIKNNRLQNRELQERRLQIAKKYYDCTTIQEGIANLWRAGFDENEIAALLLYGNSYSQRYSIRKIFTILSQRGEI